MDQVGQVHLLLVMPKKDIMPLLIEQQVDAVMAAYNGDIDPRSLVAQYPSLSHNKKAIFAAAGSLPADLEGKALYRAACKVLKAPVPDRDASPTSSSATPSSPIASKL